MKVTTDGTAGNRITFTNYPGETVVFDANNRIYAIQVGISTNPANYVTVDGIECKGWTGYGIYCQQSDFIELLRCNVHVEDFDGTDQRGIILTGCDDALIEFCRVHHCLVGIRATTSLRGTIRNSILHDGFGATEALQNNCKGYAVANGCVQWLIHNVITFNWDDGGGDSNETFGTPAEGEPMVEFRNVVAFNNGTRAGNTGGGGYGIKTKPDQVQSGGRDKVTGCYSFDNAGHGILLNSPAVMTGFDAWHNLSIRNGGDGISGAYIEAQASTSKNNIFSDNTGTDDSFNPTVANLNDYNLVKDGSFNVTYSPNSIAADPGFSDISDLDVDTDADGVPDVLEFLHTVADPLYPDVEASVTEAFAVLTTLFALAGGSACIDAGVISAPFSRDPYNGSAPDLGAIESA